MEILLTAIILTATTVLASGQVTLSNFSLREGPTVHALRSDPIQAIDTRSIKIPNLHYDGTGPDAYWIVGTGEPPAEKPSEMPGHKIPNEKGSSEILKAYSGETIVLRLPCDFTVNSIDWLAIYCVKFKHTFGYVDFSKHKEALKKLPEGEQGKSTQDCPQSTTTSTKSSCDEVQKLSMVLIVTSALLGLCFPVI